MKIMRNKKSMIFYYDKDLNKLNDNDCEEVEQPHLTQSSYTPTLPSTNKT